MNRGILILLLFLLGKIADNKSAIANNLITGKDSIKYEYLRKLSRTKPGDKARLKLYDELSKNVGSSQTELYYIDKLLKEAQEQQDNEYICKAYLGRISLAYNTFDVAAVKKWFGLLEPIARKEKLYDFLFRGKRCVIDMLNLTQDYEEEEKESLKMLEEARSLNNNIGMVVAYQSLSHAYRATFRFKEAAQILEKAYDIAYKMQDDAFLVEINNLLIGTYQSMDDRANILKWTKNMDIYLQQLIKDNPASEDDLRGWLLLTYVAYISYYTDEKDLEHAAYYLKKAENYNMVGYAAYENHYHTARYGYFRAANLYDKALVEVDQLISLYRELSPISFGIMNYKKACVLEEMGKVDDALSLYKRSFYMIDSVQVATMNKQTELLKKDYDTDQLMLKKERIQSNIQILFLVLVALIIIVLICYVIHAYRIRKGLRRSEEEMRRMADEMEQANIAKDIFLSTISKSISYPLNSVVEGSLKMASDEVQELNERKQISQNLNKTSAELMGLINNILDLSRLEAGMMKFRFEDVDIVPFIQGIATLLVSDGKTVEIVLLEVKEGMKVKVDTARLQTVLNSLLVGREMQQIIIGLSEDGLSIQVDIFDSVLASQQEPTQETIIANEVNRLLINSFRGEYVVKKQSEGDRSTSAVCFVLPLV